jgi:glycine/D-amino acid oxidase-like deaminating enzyme
MTGSLTNTPTAIVIGGGLVGAACAWQLLRAGIRTRLVDRGDARRAASWGNAGHLALEQIEPLASRASLRALPRRLFTFGGPVGLPARALSSWLPFGLRVLAAATPARFREGRRVLTSCLSAAMPAWRRLVEETGTRHLLRENGHFVAWETAKTAERGRRTWLDCDIGEAVACDASMAELERLRGLFANKPKGAIRFRNTGQLVDIAAMRDGIDRAFREAGGLRSVGTAAHLSIADGCACVVLEGGTTLAGDIVVVAAGTGSAKLLRAVEGPVPLIAERGYHVETDLEAGGWPDDMTPVAFEDRSVIVTRFASTLRLAGFTEFASDDTPADVRKWDRLERHADELGLPSGEGRSRWIGARPTLPDYLPAIGRSDAAKNLIYAFGHQHLGVTLAAMTGEIVAALAAGHTPTVGLTPLNLGRFR